MREYNYIPFSEENFIRTSSLKILKYQENIRNISSLELRIHAYQCIFLYIPMQKWEHFENI